MLALVFAGTLRREITRDYGHAHKHTIPTYALVYWADTGGVAHFFRYGDFWIRTMRDTKL